MNNEKAVPRCRTSFNKGQCLEEKNLKYSKHFAKSPVDYRHYHRRLAQVACIDVNN